ncbi:hypothetical protein CWT12_01255 [Actinomyces sp. 432]|nr:hypothetical protein CWT12_01255 [Actinomyces sp. 432]
MSQTPSTPYPGQPYSAPQPAGYGPASGPYGPAAMPGYAQAAQAPAYGNGQPGYSQQPYAQQTAYPSPAYNVPYGQAEYMQPKSKAAAAVLAFFLGGAGVHNFYRGQTRRGIAHLCLIVAMIALFVIGGIIIVANTDDYGYTPDGPSIAAGFTFFLSWTVVAANSIWAFVEFIMILVSNDGSLE